MALTINRTVLIGRLTRDPELRHTPSGASVCSLRVAVDGAGQGKDDAGEYRAGFFDVSVWGDAADNCARYLAKGRQVGIDGSLQFQEWEAQDGTKRSKVEIRAFQVQFLGSRPDGDDDRQTSTGGGDQFVPAGSQAADPFSADDDIPF